MEAAAASVLRRAVEMDNSERYTMALVLYQEGIRILLDCIREMKDPVKQKHYNAKATQYLTRAEKLKSEIEERKTAGTYRELIKLRDGDVGHGYDSVFGRFLDAGVDVVRIEDPYVRSFHQCQNLVRLCELVVRKCQGIKRIHLITSVDPKDNSQIGRLEELKQSLIARSILFEYQFSDTLHDRQISLSNGWIIKIGRGLSYFKPPEGKFVLGVCDLELRPCLETTIDIFHTSHLRNALI